MENCRLILFAYAVVLAGLPVGRVLLLPAQLALSRDTDKGGLMGLKKERDRNSGGGDRIDCFTGSRLLFCTPSIQRLLPDSLTPTPPFSSAPHLARRYPAFLSILSSRCPACQPPHSYQPALRLSVPASRAPQHNFPRHVPETRPAPRLLATLSIAG